MSLRPPTTPSQRRQGQSYIMVQFTLPKNSKITEGKKWGAATNAYSTRGPTRQPISQKSVSSRVASLKIAISSASRAGVT